MEKNPGVEKAGPSLGSVAIVALPTAALSLGLNLGVRALAVDALPIPAATLPFMPLFMASVCAVLGPAVGCYLAFRRPGPGAMKKFLLPGVILVTMGLGLEVIRFATTHRNPAALAVGLSQGLVATGLAIPILLWLVSRTRA
jgi:hypothetical protein